MSANHRWILLEGSGYFVRFAAHEPRPRIYTHRQREYAYCFASREEAQQVLDQLTRYGWKGSIRYLRPEPPQPPPVPFDPFTSFGPPDHLREWVDRILAAGPAGVDPATRIKRGFRVLARSYHPDIGGSTTSMQALSDAHQWLLENEHWAVTEVAFSDDEIPF